MWYADRRGKANNFQIHECFEGNVVRDYQIDSILLAFILEKK